MSRGSRVTRVTDQLTDGSRGSRVKKCDPLSSLAPTLLRPTGATTAEKLEGTSSAVDYRSPSFSSSTHSPSTHIAPGDDNGSAGHGSSGSTNLSGSRGSRLKNWRGPQARWITDPLPFHPPSLPRLPLLLHPSSFNHSLSCLFSPARFVRSALSSPYCPAKMTTSPRSWRGPNTLGPGCVRTACCTTGPSTSGCLASL